MYVCYNSDHIHGDDMPEYTLDWLCYDHGFRSQFGQLELLSLERMVQIVFRFNGYIFYCVDEEFVESFLHVPSFRYNIGDRVGVSYSHHGVVSGITLDSRYCDDIYRRLWVV